MKVDFVVRKDSPFRLEECWRQRCIELTGERIWMVSPEDLLLSNLVWAPAYAGRQSSSLMHAT